MSNIIISKKCSHCKQIKPIIEYFANSSQRDGYTNQCKSCHRESVNRYRNTEQGKENNRKQVLAYSQTKYGKRKRRKYALSSAGKEASKRANNKYYQKNPDRRKAKEAVHRAIYAGRLLKPSKFRCVQCNKKAQHYHHHKGYAPEYWLNVIPVCAMCHKKIHNHSPV